MTSEIDALRARLAAVEGYAEKDRAEAVRLNDECNKIAREVNMLRFRLAALEPVARAAVAQRNANAAFDVAMLNGGDAPAIGAYVMRTDRAVDALPDSLRAELAKEQVFRDDGATTPEGSEQ